jgi:hypothetical protein
MEQIGTLRPMSWSDADHVQVYSQRTSISIQPRTGVAQGERRSQLVPRIMRIKAGVGTFEAHQSTPCGEAGRSRGGARQH